MIAASRRYRLALLLSLMVVTPLGFATKWYQGPVAWWVNNYLGGALYEVFWILVVAMIWPRARALWVAAGVFGVTCALEILQLWQPSFLQVIRAKFLGRALLGTTFVIWDFFYYVVGSVLGYLWVRYLQRRRLQPAATTDWAR